MFYLYKVITHDFISMYKKTIKLIVKYFIIVYYKQLDINNFMRMRNFGSISFLCFLNYFYLL